MMAAKSPAVAIESTPLVDTISYLLWRLQSELAHAWQRQGEHELIRHRATFDLLLLLGAGDIGTAALELAQAGHLRTGK